MRFDFSDIPFNPQSFSDKPMAFCQPEVGRFFATICELVALETGPRAAREAWQSTQTKNLLRHAQKRSLFWRERIAAAQSAGLAGLPALRRADVRAQVKNEGALLDATDSIGVFSHSTSGSSGAPLSFFCSEISSLYNQMRSVAQDFIEGRDLRLNRTVVKYGFRPIKDGLSIQRAASAFGQCSSFFDGGRGRFLLYRQLDAAQLWTALCKDQPIGCLVLPTNALDMLLQHAGPEVFRRAGVAMISLYGERLDPQVRSRFAEFGVPIRQTYSCEEVGLIAVECDRCPDFFHVTTSNVIVETIDRQSLNAGEAPVGNVLLTHLHSYATPFIRYEVGDLATLSERCPCGHDGPTLSNIVGRTKDLIKFPDGRLHAFRLRAGDVLAIAPIEEYRIRQTSPTKLVVEIGGARALTPKETTAFVNMLKEHSDESFSIEIKTVEKIAWGHSVKRLGFHNEIL